MAKKDISKSQLAEQLSISPATVSRWLDGTRSFVKKLDSICTALGISTTEFYQIGNVIEEPPQPYTKKEPKPYQPQDSADEIQQLENQIKILKEQIQDKQRIIDLLRLHPL
jgi:transcriptional regulator with XRE-family HTH domain